VRIIAACTLALILVVHFTPATAQELIADSPAARCATMKPGTDRRTCLLSAARAIARDPKQMADDDDTYRLYCAKPDDMRTAVYCLPFAIAKHDCGLLPQNSFGARDPEFVELCRAALEQK
jgi:hypothetical protein